MGVARVYHNMEGLAEGGHVNELMLARAKLKKVRQVNKPPKIKAATYCDGCSKGLDDGTIRYHCSECDDLDFCDECFQSHGHEHHMFRERTCRRTMANCILE